MSRTVVVRYETRPEAAEKNERLIRAVFEELAATGPDGLRYASFRLADGVTFVHVAITEGADPLRESAAFKEFSGGVGSRVVSGPVVSEATLVGSYGFLAG